MKRSIGKVGVIGAGVMGQGIAAHFANAGIQVLLLDRLPEELTADEVRQGLSLANPQVRNRFTAFGKANLLKAKPALLYHPSYVERISVGNIADHLQDLQNVDWIIEAIIENLEAKQALFEQVEKVRGADAIISTNTSGISINRMIAGRSDEFRRNFLGAHFFNPVRYMKLLEVIPGQDTDPELLDFVKEFGERVLGKGVVVCKDTVNFIANRIGTYGLMAAFEEMNSFGLGIDDVDTLTGPAMGRPKSATFRTLDIVGLDTFVHVANNLRANVNDPFEQKTFKIPDFVMEMLKRKWIGEKAGQGFYQKSGAEILVLDPATLQYRPRGKRKFASLEAAKLQKDTAGKLKSLLAGQDEAAQFAWNLTKRVLLYTADHAFEIAETIVDIDQAMKWGFNWDVGPFELWDMIGVAKTVDRMQNEGDRIPEWIQQMLRSGSGSFYKRSEGKVSVVGNKCTYKELQESPQVIRLANLKERGKTITANPGASLIDIGDEVALLEFHSPKQAIGSDILQMIQKTILEVSKNWRGLVIGNQGKHFCVGANLMLLLMEAQDENWDDIEFIVRECQQTLMDLKNMNKPVVAAPFSMTLGGGAEVSFPADHIQASAETYIGLVEAGVGLLPGGGGNKELLLRHQEFIQDRQDVDLQPYVNRVFETIAMAKVSSSAADAKTLGYLRASDGITLNPDYLLFDAKRAVLQLAEQGYQAPMRNRLIRVVGESGYAVLQAGAYTMLQSGYISPHDYKIACKIGFVLTGGRVPSNSWVSEEYLLDLEREAFLSLIGEPKTQERMQYMLTKGKPLRN